jgi:hypothetical protein
MATVAIDLDPDYSRVCRWDGSRLQIARLAAGIARHEWNQWPALIAPGAGDAMICRSLRRPWAQDLDQLFAAARARKVAECRVIDPAVDGDPGLAAAVEVMRMHRLAAAMTLECNGTVVQCASIERGVVTAARRRRLEGRDDIARTSAATELLGEILDVPRETRFPGTAGPTTLIAFGMHGPEIADAVARAAEIPLTLIPPHAADLSAVGLLLLDAVLTFRRELPQGPSESASLRETFRRLMDEAGRAVILRGGDFDDTVVDRFVEIASGGGTHSRLIPVESLKDGTSIADACGDASQFAAMIRVRIETPKPPVLTAPFEWITA